MPGTRGRQSQRCRNDSGFLGFLRTPLSWTRIRHRARFEHRWRARHRLAHRQRGQPVRHGIGCVALRASMAIFWSSHPRKCPAIVSRDPLERGVAPLFGDGAGACLISPGWAGEDRRFGAALRRRVRRRSAARHLTAPLEMNGRSVILQASRKIPSAIGELLERNSKPAVVGESFPDASSQSKPDGSRSPRPGVDAARFYSNIRRYGNTSSASMLIAAAEWWRDAGPRAGDLICFAAFGAGFHWGALLARNRLTRTNRRSAARRIVREIGRERPSASALQRVRSRESATISSNDDDRRDAAIHIAQRFL